MISMDAGDATSFSFAAYGDSATNPTPTGFRQVQDRINQIDATDGIAFSLSLGDNVYNDGTHQPVPQRGHLSYRDRQVR